MRIHHISITVKNLDESIRFYENVFGFEVVKRFERPDLQGRAAFLMLDNQVLETWEFSDTKSAGNNLNDLKFVGIRHFGIEVKNLDSALQEMSKKGIKFTVPISGKSGGRYSFISDPNGIPIEIYEPGN